MGDVNLEIKLNNIDERLTAVEENGGSGGGGDSYIESVSSDFKVVNKKLSLSDIVKTAINSISNKINKPQSANDGDALIYDSNSNEWLPQQIETENYINDVSNDFNVIDKLLSLKDDIKNKINSIGDISLLGTVDKTDIVRAINSLTVGGVNNGVYSEDEIIIGQWLDGRPLYRRKVIPVVNGTASSWNNLCLNNFDVEIMINLYGWNTSSKNFVQCNFSRFNDGYIQYFVQNGSYHTNSIVFLEYIKTTD